ncbi:MAG TPA: hypothetical protein VF384_00575 [Planctomycetota bacterium]
MSTSFARFTMTAILLAASAHAQIVMDRFGFLVTGQTGTAGEFCWTFDCTPRQLAVVSGETLTMRINGPHQTLFAIGASLGASNCIPIPGFTNALILDVPIIVLSFGLISQQSPILACWGGTETVQFQVPPGLPTGVSFATQAIADLQGPTPGLSFSVAVVSNVQ